LAFECAQRETQDIDSIVDMTSCLQQSVVIMLYKCSVYSLAQQIFHLILFALFIQLDVFCRSVAFFHRMTLKKLDMSLPRNTIQPFEL
jgi:hypothetical protein